MQLERLQVELVGESATIAENRRAVRIGRTPLELLAKPVEIYDRRRVGSWTGEFAGRFIGASDL